MGVVVVVGSLKEIFSEEGKHYVVVDEGVLRVFERDELPKGDESPLKDAKLLGEFSDWTYWRMV